ncbi:unnamed protein product, partial [Dicrocoelium dendriticum]
HECQKIKLMSLTEDQFECVILVCSLHSPKYAEIRTRMLGRLEQDSEVALQNLFAEAERNRNFKRETYLLEDLWLHTGAITVQQVSKGKTSANEYEMCPQA